MNKKRKSVRKSTRRKNRVRKSVRKSLKRSRQKYDGMDNPSLDVIPSRPSIPVGKVYRTKVNKRTSPYVLKKVSPYNFRSSKSILDFFNDFDYTKPKQRYSYYLDVYRVEILIEVDKNVLQNLQVSVYDVGKKLCKIDIGQEYDLDTSAYYWGVYCDTKKAGSGLLDLVCWIFLYLFREYYIRGMTAGRSLKTQERARREGTSIVLFNLIRKSKSYSDLDYNTKVSNLCNERLWLYEKFNFKFDTMAKLKLVEWFLSSKLSADDPEELRLMNNEVMEHFGEEEADWIPLSEDELKHNIITAYANLKIDYIC